jgi:hypothetical protein
VRRVAEADEPDKQIASRDQQDRSGERSVHNPARATQPLAAMRLVVFRASVRHSNHSAAS